MPETAANQPDGRDERGPAPPAGEQAIDRARRALIALAQRARAALVAQRAARGVAVALAIVTVLVAADVFLRLPAGLRVAHLILGAGAAGWAVWRRLIPAWRLRPDPAVVALRVERLHPEIAGLLASGIEFAEGSGRSRPSSQFEAALARAVARRAGAEFSREDLRGALRLAPLGHALLTLALVAIAGGSIALARPELARIGLTRALAPWSGAEWPKRTMVADVTGIEVHARGSAIPIRAALVRSTREPERTDVTVEHRAIRDGAAGPTRSELLTWQRRVTDTPAGARGELFERLIEVDAEAVEYRLVTLDDRTGWRRVRLVPPPEVVSARVRIEPPAYASGLARRGDAGPITEPTEADLGAGTDERAIAPPALAGSGVELALTLNKPVPAQPNDAGWLAATFGPDAAAAGLTLTVDPAEPNRWRLRWRLDDSVRLALSLVDEFGIAGEAEAVFRFPSVADRPASATITKPASDLTVLATAVVEVEGEGRDDVGLERVWLERQRVRPAGAQAGSPSGPGGALEPAGEPVRLAEIAAAGARRAVARATIDLAPLGLTPGDQVWLTARAQDVFASAGAPRPASVSAVRVLRVITEDEFIAEVRGELSAIRQSAIRLFEEQAQLRELSPDRRAGAEAQRRQGQITDRLQRLDQAVERAQRRVRDNALGDRALENVLDDAGRLLRDAGEWSGRASDRQARADLEREGPIDKEAERQVDDAQRRVQDELANLAELLDTGQDAWVARRRLESLLEDQRALAERTAQAGRQTAGKPVEALTEQERSELDAIVDRQNELAQQAEELARDLKDRAREMEESDPAAAAGMRQAARRARESDTAQTMRQAARNAQQNQTADAGRRQEQAAQDLEQMLEDMDHAERSREEVLRRVIASLIESLDALIAQQERALAALAAAEEAGDLAGLDRGMIRLNQNTLGVLDQASGAGRELAPVADLIGRAVEAQTRAILALRAEPADAPEARDGETQSLELLTEARARAEELDRQMQERQQDRARRELRRAYREALERQVELRESAGALAEVADPDRRQRLEIRRLAAEERDLAASLRDLRDKTEDIAQAAVFDYTHDRLDTATGRAAEALDAGDAGSALAPADTAIALLQGLVEALREEPPGERDFSENAGGGGSGAGGQGQPQPLIPPIAELRLLRQIQIDLARRTRRAADAGADADEARALGDEQAELGELGADLIRRMQEQQGAPPAGGPTP
ncbi:MAG: hypothetical protein D6693_04055 [Planctomycetota bacterium]|nr:MAG: hypothetical protein D6693_04055 [Planctomycetota bacterium]